MASKNQQSDRLREALVQIETLGYVKLDFEGLLDTDMVRGLVGSQAIAHCTTHHTIYDGHVHTHSQVQLASPFLMAAMFERQTMETDDLD